VKVYIVVPAHNEAIRIKKVISQLAKTNYPIIVVDDGSTDNTYKRVDSKKVLLIRHRINLGKGAAMKTGAQAAFKKGAQAVVFMDADGQHKSSDLPKFIAKLNQGYEVVFGSRNYYMGIPLIRYLGNKFASVLVRMLFGLYVSDLLCGYRAVTKKAFKKMDWESMGYGVETEMAVLVAKKRLKRCEVSVAAVYYDKFKGVTILDSFGILLNVLRWRITK